MYFLGEQFGKCIFERAIYIKMMNVLPDNSDEKQINNIMFKQERVLLIFKGAYLEPHWNFFKKFSLNNLV